MKLTVRIETVTDDGRDEVRIEARVLPSATLQLAKEIWEFEQLMNTHTASRWHLNLEMDADDRITGR